jgi:DNA-binding transcriptional LysR family regulator
VRLSPPGEAFLHHARAMLEQTRQLQADLQEYGAGLRGHVRVFANTTAVTEFMPDILAAYLMQHPHISVDLQERPNAHIAHDIREGRADLGIIAGEVDTHGLTSLHFSTDRLVLVTPDTPAWRSHQQIAFAQVLHEHFVGMHRHSTLQTFWTRSASSWATHCGCASSCPTSTPCAAWWPPAWVAVVPESAALRHRSQSPLHRVQLQDAWAVRPRYMLLREGQTPSPHVQALMDAIQAYHLPQHAPQAGGAAAG